MEKLLLSRRDGCMPRVLFVRMFFLCFSVFLVCRIFPSRYERRGDFSIEHGSDWDA